jgi:hypothetical protein
VCVGITSPFAQRESPSTYPDPLHVCAWITVVPNPA